MEERLKSGSVSIDFIETQAEHKELGYSIDIRVPLNATHRPAVKDFLNGRYYENFSHISFTKILNYKKNISVVHAGAFFGDMLHTYAQVAKIVYAFEPVLDNFVLAKNNIARMGLNNIIMINAGLSDKSDLGVIKTSDAQGRFAGGGSEFVQPYQAVGGSFETVPIFRIDDLPIYEIGLLQLDVENHELQALRGAVNLIATCRPIILIEDNNNCCADFLKIQGYEFVFGASGLKYWALPEDLVFVSSLRP